MDNVSNVVIKAKQAAMTYEILRPKEAAPVIGSTDGMLAQMRHRGIGPKYLVIGKTSVRYRLSDLLAYLDSRTVDPALPLPRGVERARGGPGRGHKVRPRKNPGTPPAFLLPEGKKRARR